MLFRVLFLYFFLSSLLLGIEGTTSEAVPHRTGSQPTPQKCGSFLSRLPQVIGPPRTPWDNVRYTTALAQLTEIFSDPNASPTLRQEQVLHSLRTHPTPETYGALFDTLMGETSPVADSLTRLAEQGTQVRNGNYPWWRFGRRNTLDGRIRWGRQWTGTWDQLFRSHPHTLDLIWPTSAPENIADVTHTLLQLSHLLAEAESAELRRRVPWTSLPLGSRENSYPRQINEIAQRWETRTYGLVDTIQRQLGQDISGELREKQVRTPSLMELPFHYLWHTYFPYFDPLKKFEPNQRGYHLWRANPSAYQSPSQGRRAGLMYYTSWIKSAILASALTGGAVGASNLYDIWRNTPIREIANVTSNVLDLAKDPTKVEEANRAFETTPGGNPVVLEHYNRSIAKLRERIEREGDPQGELARQIQTLESNRNYYRN